jgi:hypothetical protein
MEININERLQVERREQTERIGDSKKASFQQKRRWANQKAEPFESTEVTRRFHCYPPNRQISLTMLEKPQKWRFSG